MNLSRIEELSIRLREMNKAVPFLSSLVEDEEWKYSRRLLILIDRKTELYEKELRFLLEKYMYNLILDNGSDYYQDNYTKLIEDTVNDLWNPYLDELLEDGDSFIWEIPVDKHDEWFKARK